MNFPLKPAPDAIRYIIKNNALEPTECMMLGDRSIDVGSGANAGIATCLFDEDGTLTDVPCTLYTRDTAKIFDFAKKNFECE